MTGELFCDLAAGKPRDRHEYWGPIVNRASLTLLYAPTGIGKTFFALKLAHSIAAGNPFLKWAGCGNERVLFFDGEMGRDLIRERLIKIDDASIKGVVGDALHLISYAHLPEKQLWNLSEPEDQKKYAEAIKPYKIIIIDNLLSASFPRDGRDDDVRQWQRIQPFLVRLRDEGKAIVIVHHAGKSGAQIGTSQRENIMDNILALRRARSITKDPGLLDLIFDKARSLSRDDRRSLRLELSDKDSELGHWRFEDLEAAQKRDIQNLKKDGYSTRDICEILGVFAETVLRHTGAGKSAIEWASDSDGDVF